MGKANSYYLVAREKDTSRFDIIDCGSTLEEIDLYTIDFKDEEEIINKLLSENKINSNNIDLFIACPRKIDAKNYIRTLNLLFYNNRGIGVIAKQSINKELPSQEADELINKFCYKMETNSEFFNMVSYGKTKLYSKFTDYFVNKRFQKTYDIKYQDGGWVRKSYPLLRNICDTFNIFNKKLNTNRYDEINNDVYRSLMEDKMLEKLNTDYKEKQFSLFDMENFTSDNATDEDKVIEIMTTFDNLGSGIIGLKDNKISVITDKMDKVGEEEKDSLETLLDSRLITALYYFLSHKNGYLEQFKKNEFHDFYETLVREDYKEIVSLLKNKEVFENASKWVKIYNKCLGDVDGYQRRKEDNRT